MSKKPTMLLILDGFGYSEEQKGNGVAAAKKPNFDRLWDQYCHGYLDASGLEVGLPAGQIGNSEVGHMNMGAGRVVYQDLTRITKYIKDGDFFENPVLNEAMDHASKAGKTVHLMGLLSNGGVHSHIDHVIALLEMAKRKGVENIVLHAFLDGRDVLPTSALEFLDQIQNAMAEKQTGRIASIMGRFYAMDRDKRWERLQVGYEALTLGEGVVFEDYHEAIKASYAEEITDEFVKPIIVGEGAKVEDGDTVIFYNYRTDRAREMLWAFKDPDFEGFERKALPDVHYVCFTQCDASYDVPVAFPKESMKNDLGCYLSACGKKQLRIAETEKYAHVTFFFNSQVEEPYEGEDRILIPSLKVASYDETPGMSACGVTTAVLKEIEAEKHDVIILNFANPDMVGHTGNFEAVVESVEYVDECVGRIVEAVLAKGGEVFLTADHGNAEKMFDADGGPYTAHTNNPVPYVMIGDRQYEKANGHALCDIAPTLLHLMGLEQPAEMTGVPIITVAHNG
ncbi:MAG: 2,3-bisphosphoglycerate-independent phosphoglycerate mutase [Firmicutes bacterium]|nr:2,3-bisphosphoglycerate-independent phosphoglycerate mutase [Bacillota bacterium]